MANIDLSQLIGFPLLDIIPAELGAENARPGSSVLFDDYLQRAQTSSINNGINNSARNSGQSQTLWGEEPDSAAALPPPCQKNKEDNVDDNNAPESAGNAKLPMSENQQSANNNKPVEQDQAGSRSNKEEEDDKKDKRDNRDSAPAGKNPDNQLNVRINSETANANKHSQSGDNASTIQIEMDETSNSLHIASKGAKTTTGSDELTKADIKTANTLQTAIAEEPDASVSAPKKGKSLKKAALEEGKNTERPSLTQVNETASISNEGETYPAMTSKDISASPHDAHRKNAHQNEKMGPSTARVAEATVSPSLSQDSPSAAATPNSAALQATVNPPFMATKPAKDKIDLLSADRPSNVASNDKAANPANALQRLEQSANKTTAAKSQGNGKESGSDLNSERFVQRVERAFAAMSDRGGTVRLKLSPPELGSVRMEISVNKGVMKARLEAETKEAKNLLLENLPALRDRLAQQNIKIQKFDVDLRDPSSGGMSQQTPNQAETGSRGGGYRAPQPQSRENGQAAPPTTGTSRLANHNGQLNVIV